MMKRLLVLIVVSLCFSATLSADSEEHWSYDHNGSKHWGEENTICDAGKAQSPINIISNKTASTLKDFEIVFYEKLAYKADVIDNGHSIKVIPKNNPHVVINGEKYILVQFHYHGKSEHSVDGKFYDLVVHGVCQNPKTKALAVVGIFYEEGKSNKLLERVLNHIGDTVVITKNLLPKHKEEYYHYRGSLTTPPCSENVEWYILKRPLEASKEQIAKMRIYYVNNFRPVQELHNRVIDEH